MYELTIKKVARKAMGRQPPAIRQRMEEEIEKLAANPDDPDLNTGPVTNSDYFRLKFSSPANGFRAVYSRDDEAKAISIIAISSRGQAYDIL